MHARRPARRNFRTIEQEAAKINAKVIWHNNKKHHRAQVLMPDGREIWLTISRSAEDVRKLRVWFRQDTKPTQRSR